MTSVRILWLALCLTWVIAEIRLARQSSPDRRSIVHSERNSQRWLWLSVLTSLGLALWFKKLAWLPIPIPYITRQLLAMSVFAAGLCLRYWAVRHLGHFFTTHVTIQNQHTLITTGPYRFIRHPAYTGLLLAFAAAGLAMGDGLAWLFLIAPPFWAFKRRIDIEERLLQQQFTTTYRDYCNRTWKLLPWLF